MGVKAGLIGAGVALSALGFGLAVLLASSASAHSNPCASSRGSLICPAFCPRVEETSVRTSPQATDARGDAADCRPPSASWTVLAPPELTIRLASHRKIRKWLGMGPKT